MVSKKDIKVLEDVRNNEEIVMFGSVRNIIDNEEPRYEIKIIGPEGLMKKLYDVIAGFSE